MTVQVSDVLINDCSDVDVDGLHPYGVVIGDINSNYGWGEPYPFASVPAPSTDEYISFLWRGYVSIYRLNSAGQLILEKYAYPNLGRKREPDLVNEVLVGDFFLVMKMKFEGVRTYIPFKRGRIVTDREEWIIEED